MTLAFAWPQARVGFTIVKRTSEFAGQQESDRFGQRRPRVDRTGCKIRSA
jgi:hypothetical protein